VRSETPNLTVMCPTWFLAVPWLIVSFRAIWRLVPSSFMIPSISSSPEVSAPAWRLLRAGHLHRQPPPIKPYPSTPALTWHPPPPAARILDAGAGALSARRFVGVILVLDPRGVTPLPDLVRRLRRSKAQGRLLAFTLNRTDIGGPRAEGGKRQVYAFAALLVGGVHGPWCGDRRRRVTSLRCSRR
jgi:hypothetical protein